MTRLVRAWHLTRHLFWNLVAAGTGQGATLILTLTLANLLGPAQFGRFSVATSTILALSALAQFGLAFTATNFVARHVAGDRSRAERIAGFCTAGALLAGIAIGLAVAIAAWPIAAYLYGDASLYPLFIVAGATIPAATLGLIQNAIMIGLQAFRALAMNAILYAIAVLAAAFAGYAAAGPLGAAIGYGVATTVRVLHGSYLLQREFASLRPWRWPRDVRVLARELMPFSIPAALAGLTLTPAVWLSNAWLVNAHGLHEIGLFSTAFMIKTLVVFVPIQIGTVFLPRYVAAGEADPAQANRYLGRVMLLVLAFSAVLAGAIALAAPWLMCIFGAAFIAATPALRWLMLTVVAESVATIGSYRLAGERRMWTSLLAYTLPKDLILLTAAGYLVQRHGASGLAAAHLISWSYGVTVVVFLAIGGNRARRTVAPRAVPDDRRIDGHCP